MNTSNKLLTLITATILMSACSTTKELTLHEISKKELEYKPAELSLPSREDAAKSYREFLSNSSRNERYSDALRRLADLELEIGEFKNTQDNQQVTIDGQNIMLSSIEHYKTYLKSYPDNKTNDLILYQLAKAYSLIGENEKALEVMDSILSRHPNTQYIDEIQFRRGEILFTFGEYSEAERAYQDIVSNHPESLYFEKALYKLGWSQFKQSNYYLALGSFFKILDIKQQEGKILADTLNLDIAKSEQDFINDVLRVISYSLSYKDGTDTIAGVFAKHNDRLYIPLIYKNLGELYLSKERHNDAATVFIDFTKAIPTSPLAPDFHNLAINAYQLGKFNDEALEAKKLFTQNYGVNSTFWKYQSNTNRQRINSHLKKHILDLANYYHAIASKTKSLESYQQAAYWYRMFIVSFPNDSDTPSINFLLAESYFDSKNYYQALTEYEKTAYFYSSHDKSSEAGYAALITYDMILPNAQAKDSVSIKANRIQSAIRFCNKFPEHKHAIAVTVKTAEDLYEAQNFVLASEFAQRIIDKTDVPDKSHKQTARIVLAHSRFELKQYKEAELAYTETLKYADKTKPIYKELSERLAASIYKQGEQHRDAGQYELAALSFLSIGKAVPFSSIRATAEYDAATMYIKTQQWDKATPILEGFRKSFPNDKKYSKGISEKLALSYTESGQFSKAAKEISYLASVSTSPADKQNLTWQAAEMYEKSGNKAKANELYISYVRNYPRPFGQYIEAHYVVSEYYRNSKDYKSWSNWLRETVKAEKSGGAARTDRTNFIAASALIHLVKPVIKQFEAAQLKIPLKKSLAVKKKYMEQSLASYKEIMSYQIAEFTTESTYRVAEIYHQMAVSLMKSQRPKGLGDEELEQYNILLEEQAYPFEEKAIDIHASNIQRTKDGIYDNWVKKSMEILATIQPIRYQKKEKAQDYALLEQ